eukprot:gnl/TRDRNA2_/TRDRNA2_105439_c0_seq1.p1 gnl/TRDRNA2_/TRDRNA2_105439_c0~~gnl/TRDRNA2_/TRDRNA2_105439_c0_seq1.p1  ORF type:complete len:140 (-),score=9.15 gnl/TRDRNA2_/TRDRNA2_105439_c0_seq1:21-440(-)
MPMLTHTGLRWNWWRHPGRSQQSSQVSTSPAEVVDCAGSSKHQGTYHSGCPERGCGHRGAKGRCSHANASRRQMIGTRLRLLAWGENKTGRQVTLRQHGTSSMLSTRRMFDRYLQKWCRDKQSPASVALSSPQVISKTV